MAENIYAGMVEFEMNEVKLKIDTIIVNILGENGIYLSSISDISLLELGIDSILFITLVIEIEEEFGINIPDEYMNLEDLSSLDKICKIVIEQMN